MKYMLLIYVNPEFAADLSEQERTDLFGEVDAIMDGLRESGELVGFEALADASTTRTVKLREGLPAVTDGPFMESKELFGGYLIVDCENLERAVEIAAGWPDVRFGGALEVRAIMTNSEAEM
jgi:hypothetical protein